MAEVVQLHTSPLTDIPARLRKLADDIEAGDYGDVTSTLVVIPYDGAWPAVMGFGDVHGDNHPLVVLELAKAFMVHRAVDRG